MFDSILGACWWFCQEKSTRYFFVCQLDYEMISLIKKIPVKQQDRKKILSLNLALSCFFYPPNSNYRLCRIFSSLVLKENLLRLDKVERFKKIACIRSYHLQWKFKLLAGKFTWGNEAKHCCVMSTFCFQKFVDNAQQCFAFTPHAIFPAHNLNFHWRWRWWDRIQATF